MSQILSILLKPQTAWHFCSSHTAWSPQVTPLPCAWIYPTLLPLHDLKRGDPPTSALHSVFICANLFSHSCSCGAVSKLRYPPASAPAHLRLLGPRPWIGAWFNGKTLQTGSLWARLWAVLLRRRRSSGYPTSPFPESWRKIYYQHSWKRSLFIQNFQNFQESFSRAIIIIIIIIISLSHSL